MDLLLRNGRLIDGSGGPAREADVVVRGGEIVAVGELDDVPGAEEVDLGGLVLAPGFIDIHTHYDAQVLWDPDLTPSSWHGVTSVIVGNCGFGIAPTRPADRSTILRTLENVEGMALEALESGVSWSFETFPEYLDVVSRLPKRINLGVLVGHTPLRHYVMGEAATERAARPEEVARMRALVAEAIGRGAVGFSTSASPTHLGAEGKPVPSRFAEPEEVVEVARGMADAGRGVMQATAGPGLFVDQFSEISTDTGRPVSWTAVLTGMAGRRGGSVKLIDWGASKDGEIWPQIACRPLVMQVTLEDPFPMSPIPAFQEVLALPRERRADLYRDAAWRDRARPEMGKFWGERFSRATVQETECHPGLRNGPSLVELAAARGVDPFDLMVDLALNDDLRTRYRVVLANDDEEELAELLRDRRAVLGLSDAGAHASQLCDANFATFLLGNWSRDKGVIPLEEAVWRLTGQPAEVYRLERRGRVATGFVADLVAFDPDTVGTEDLERVWDLPGGADRLIARSRGVEHVWVGGEAVRRDGKPVEGARPGVLLEAGRF
jgi:N-acyl-D-amino-acid deacylase